MYALRMAFALVALLASSCGGGLGGATPRPTRLAEATANVTPAPPPTVAAATANPTPVPTPPVASATGYSFLSVQTARGTFSVHLIKERLSDVSVKTLTANADVCRAECPVKPLARYVEEGGAYAGINGTYFCPPDYLACAGKVNSSDYAVYNSALPRWVNLPALFGNNAVLTFNGSLATAYRRQGAYTQGPAWNQPITAGISMYPLLLQGGAIVNTEARQSAAQLQRNTKGAIGIDGTHVYLALVLSASLTDTAAVLQALGAKDALNLDGGGTAAMYIGGSYKVGPGRELPNAIVLTRP